MNRLSHPLLSVFKLPRGTRLQFARVNSGRHAVRFTFNLPFHASRRRDLRLNKSVRPRSRKGSSHCRFSSFVEIDVEYKIFSGRSRWCKVAKIQKYLSLIHISEPTNS